MDALHILDTIRQFVAQEYELPLEQVSPDTALGGGLVGDMYFAMLATDCEQAFHVLIPDSIIDKLSTVGELVRYIEQQRV